MSLAFLLIWMPLPVFLPPSLFFLLVLLVYDTAFTFVYVSVEAMLVDLSKDPGVRSTANAWAAAASCVSSGLAVFTSTHMYDADAMQGFRYMAAALAVLALAMFLVAMRMLDRAAAAAPRRVLTKTAMSHLIRSGRSVRDFLVDLRRVVANRNFLIFVVVAALQTTLCAFTVNMLPLHLEAFGAETSNSLLLAAVFVLPHVVVILMRPLVVQWGADAVIRSLFWTRVCVALFASTISSPSVAIGALILSRILVESTCRQLNLVTAELADDDQEEHGESESRAGLILGVAALISKPGESLGPVIGWWLLGPKNDDAPAIGDSVEFRLLAVIVVAVPGTIAALQAFLWTFLDHHEKKVPGKAVQV